MENLTFSDYFNISSEVISDYGAINPCIAYDLPLFIDPFLIFASEKQEYKELHKKIIRYLNFLYNESKNVSIDSGRFKHWFVFSEIKQNWFGYSEGNNYGKSGALKMGRALRKNLEVLFNNYDIDELKNVVHLSELNIIEKGIGKDNISDFTVQMILEYLLEYTQTFTLKYILKEQQIKKNVAKVYFDYNLKRWLPKEYILPRFDNDFVLLVPSDIVVREKLWINKEDMLETFEDIPITISNVELRDTLNNYYYRALPQVRKKDGTLRAPFKKEKIAAADYTITKNPIAIKYYLKDKENHKDLILETNKKHMNYVIKTLSRTIPVFAKELAEILKNEFKVKLPAKDSYTESLDRIKFLKKVIEVQDGYKLFYDKEKNIIGTEASLQKYFKAVWYATKFSVDSEVNNGRGPVDFKISFGADDQTIIEFKLASNSQIKDNLQKQAEIYAAANNNPHIIKVILYFTKEEEQRIINILKELHLYENENIILIDARKDNKQSASKVKK